MEGLRVSHPSSYLFHMVKIKADVRNGDENVLTRLVLIRMLEATGISHSLVGDTAPRLLLYPRIVVLTGAFCNYMF